MPPTREMTIASVGDCEVERCSYNRDHTCHARAITVGDEHSPLCDTFVCMEGHTAEPQVAGVGACKITECSHNSDLQCQAGVIEVAMVGDAPRCETFTQA